MKKVMFYIGGMGFLIGICSGGNPVITGMILLISMTMILAGGKEAMNE